MKKIESFLVFTLMILLILRYFQLPYITPPFIITFSLLALFYFPGAVAYFNGIELRDLFKTNYSKVLGKETISFTLVMGMVIAMMLIAVMFYVLHYPGAVSMLQRGGLFGTVLLVITLYKYKKTKSAYYRLSSSRLLYMWVMDIILLIFHYSNT